MSANEQPQKEKVRFEDILMVLDTILSKEVKYLKKPEKELVKYLNSYLGQKLKKKIKKNLALFEIYIPQDEKDEISAVFFKYLNIIDYFPHLYGNLDSSQEERKQEIDRFQSENIASEETETIHEGSDDNTDVINIGENGTKSKEDRRTKYHIDYVEEDDEKINEVIREEEEFSAEAKTATKNLSKLLAGASNKKKGSFSSIFFIGLIVIVLAAGGYFFLLDKKILVKEEIKLKERVDPITSRTDLINKSKLIYLCSYQRDLRGRAIKKAVRKEEIIFYNQFLIKDFESGNYLDVSIMTNAEGRVTTLTSTIFAQGTSDEANVTKDFLQKYSTFESTQLIDLINDIKAPELIYKDKSMFLYWKLR
ncbi:MAG: hypothetical protein HQK84_06070 [Nitrospinae bacterium]|nr:hypothetical protein [Nitrospinota bacterium]